MLDQPGQAGMRNALHCRDLALDTNLLAGIQVQLQSYNVTGGRTVRPKDPGSLKDCPLATNTNFRANSVPPTQGSFYICGHKWVNGHSMCQAGGGSALGSCSQSGSRFRLHRKHTREKMSLGEGECVAQLWLRSGHRYVSF